MGKLRHIAIPLPNPRNTIRPYRNAAGVAVAGESDSSLAAIAGLAVRARS